MMKVIAFNGSPRKKGNTDRLVDMVLAELSENGINTEKYHLGGKKVRGCRACYKCVENRDRHCVMDDDCVNECIDLMFDADGIIIASPTYFSNVTAEVKALIDRAGLVVKVNGDMLRRKAGAAVVAVRRAGSIHVFNSINHFFLINQMIVPGSIYWNMAIGRDPGEVESDEEGVRTMKVLGENMAYLLERLHAGQVADPGC
jgi:multimeric flavodoxin WrbA